MYYQVLVYIIRIWTWKKVSLQLGETKNGYKRCSGYVSSEYIKKDLYSIKSDMYSFGVLLLQIISGRMTWRLYGEHENLSLMEYVSKVNIVLKL